MKIGVDFGTTYTKIAYMQDGELKLFRYPGPMGRDYIPTALAYRREKSAEVISIGEAACEEMMNYEGVQYAERFKMLLPIRNEREWAQHGWNLSHRPEEVTREFFHQLLRASESSLQKTLGNAPESIVVSIPEVWQRTPNNFGAETLRRVLVDELKLPVDHLRSEPICAAAYFVYEYQRSEHSLGDKFNLLVCDMGGGTFDVALCQVRGQKIDVLDFDGMGQQGLGSAGALFDHNAVRTALAKCNENLPPSEITALLRDFERHKILSHDKVHRELRQLLALDDPLLADTVVYQFSRKYSLTFAEVKECFAPVADAISGVLTRLKNRCKDRQWNIDRIAIVGGFGQFPLVQHTILRTLDIEEAGDERFDKRLHTDNRQFYAIAYGAALIANGIIEPIEYYPHAIAVRVSVLTSGRWKEDYLPIVQAGKVAAGLEKPCWAEQDGKRVAVRVERQAVAPIPVYIRVHGSGDWLALDLPPAEYPAPGTYYIGISIDRSNMGTLVFESTEGQGRKEYRLGDVNPVLTVEVN